MRAGKSFVVGSVLGAVVCGLGVVPAQAATGHPGHPKESAPLLRIGFGSISLPEVATTANGMSGAPDGCGDIEGAAAWQVPLDERARLTLEVAEIDADGLCAIGVYRRTNGSDTLDSLYDHAERAAFAVREKLCTATCSMAATLERDTHYVVVWPKGSGDESQRVSLTGRLRGFARASGSLTGIDAGACRRIDIGDTSTFRFDIDPAPSGPDAVVDVVREYRPTGAKTIVDRVLLDDDGEGSIVVQGARGHHDFSVVFDGSETREPVRMIRCLAVRGPTKARVVPKDYRFFYDDYAVYNDGDRVILRIPVGPGSLARGRLNLRFERNIGNHQYVPFEVRRGIEVDDGLAIFRMRATYRSNGYPFYRVRAEWPGSNTHAPAKSGWICIQFNP